MSAFDPLLPDGAYVGEIEPGAFIRVFNDKDAFGGTLGLKLDLGDGRRHVIRCVFRVGKIRTDGSLRDWTVLEKWMELVKTRPHAGWRQTVKALWAGQRRLGKRLSFIIRSAYPEPGYAITDVNTISRKRLRKENTMDEHVRNPRVYLAGKISQDHCWREDIIQNYDDRDWGRRAAFAFEYSEKAFDPETIVSIRTHSGPVDVVGPFFMGMDHEGLRGRDFHAGDDTDYDPADRDATQKLVHAVSMARISRADFVFACINEVDCFGTIAEIGVAHGSGVPVHLFFGENLTLQQRYDLWFVARCATRVHERISIRHAFSRALKFQYTLKTNAHPKLRAV